MIERGGLMNRIVGVEECDATTGGERLEVDEKNTFANFFNKR
jgi:hypothetical protein